MIVDANDNVKSSVVFYWRSDDDALNAAPVIAFELGRLQEFSGAFEHDVAAEIAPRYILGHGRGAEAERMIVDCDR
jgi:hypothetical protein